MNTFKDMALFVFPMMNTEFIFKSVLEALGLTKAWVAFPVLCVFSPGHCRDPTWSPSVTHQPSERVLVPHSSDTGFPRGCPGKEA